MINMGKSKGQQVWYTEGKSIQELMEAGDIVALPNGDGMIFKRAARCTPLELLAALTVEEAKEIEAKRMTTEITTKINGMVIRKGKRRNRPETQHFNTTIDLPWNHPDFHGKVVDYVTGNFPGWLLAGYVPAKEEGNGQTNTAG